MASGALFGGPAARSQSKNLVEFRAGKMTMKGKMVNPDKRKGLVYVYQSDDSLMHFCWKDRTKGTVDDDLIIFPDDIEFKNVPQCTTGRVYLLKFKSSSRKFFFWMQEPKTDKDDEHCRKVNELLNNPPAPGSSRSTTSGFSGLPPELASGLGEGDLQNLFGNMNQQQLMQLLGGMGMSGMGGLSSLMGGRPSSASHSESTPPSRVQSSPGPRVTESVTPTPSTTTAATTTSTTSSTSSSSTTSQRPATAATLTTTTTQSTTPVAATTGTTSPSTIQLSDLQNILGSLAPPEQKDAVDLASAITPEAMIPMLANSQIQERLIPFLPEGEILPKTEQELRSTISSPQFQQAMSSFSAALQSGQLGPLMPQFGLGEDVATAASQGDVDAFVKAMQAAQAKKEEAMEPEKKD